MKQKENIITIIVLLLVSFLSCKVETASSNQITTSQAFKEVSSIHQLQQFLYESGYNWKYKPSKLYKNEVESVELFTYHINGDHDSELEYIIIQEVKPVLFEEEYYDAALESNNIYYIDKQNNKYIIVDSIIEYDMSYFTYKKDLHISDLNRDGVDELHLEKRSMTTSPGVESRSNLLSIENGKIELKNSVQGRLKLLDALNRKCYSITPIWHSGEGRYDDHYFIVTSYDYGNGEFVQSSTDTTSRRFNGFNIDKINIVYDAIGSPSSNNQNSVQTYSIELASCNQIYNDHVGNEWYYSSYINGNLLNYRSKAKFHIPSNKKVLVQSILMETNEKYNDFGKLTEEFDLSERPTIIKQKVTITESNGRYAGNTASFEFVYRLTY